MTHVRTLYSFHEVTIFPPVRELIRKQQQQQQQKQQLNGTFQSVFSQCWCPHLQLQWLNHGRKLV